MGGLWQGPHMVAPGGGAVRHVGRQFDLPKFPQARARKAFIEVERPAGGGSVTGNISLALGRTENPELGQFPVSKLTEVHLSEMTQNY